MEIRKHIALVAHDNRKKDLAEWVAWNSEELVRHKLICTGTTGKLVEETLKEKFADMVEIVPEVKKLKSGPMGGDQQLGSLISDGDIDILIFFWDPMMPQPHDVDVKALLRISVLYNVPTACNRASADFIISSHLMNEAYKPVLKDYSDYIERNLNI